MQIGRCYHQLPYLRQGRWAIIILQVTSTKHRGRTMATGPTTVSQPSSPLDIHHGIDTNTAHSKHTRTHTMTRQLRELGTWRQQHNQPDHIRELATAYAPGRGGRGKVASQPVYHVPESRSFRCQFELPRGGQGVVATWTKKTRSNNNNNASQQRRMR
jgi:hypothetical protein